MYQNSYAGLLEPWKLQLLNRRTRRFGLRGHDLDDAQQEIVLELLAFQYDPGRSNGAAEATAIVAVIDRRLAMICRREHRHRQRAERFKTAMQAAGESPHSVATASPDGLTLDVQDALDDLPPVAREICVALAHGESVSKIAKRLGMSWRAVRQQMQRTCCYFRFLGLDTHGHARPGASL